MEVKADAVCRPGNEGKNRTDFYRTLNDYCRYMCSLHSVDGYLGADCVIKDFEQLVGKLMTYCASSQR